MDKKMQTTFEQLVEEITFRSGILKVSFLLKIVFKK